MAGKNRQIHFYLKTEEHERLIKEADDLEISISELIRIKLSNNINTKGVLFLNELKKLMKREAISL